MWVSEWRQWKRNGARRRSIGAREKIRWVGADLRLRQRRLGSTDCSGRSRLGLGQRRARALGGARPVGRSVSTERCGVHDECLMNSTAAVRSLGAVPLFSSPRLRRRRRRRSRRTGGRRFILQRRTPGKKNPTTIDRNFPDVMTGRNLPTVSKGDCFFLLIDLPD